MTNRTHFHQRRAALLVGVAAFLLVAATACTPTSPGGTATTTTTVPAGPWTASSVSAGYLHTCATTPTGGVRCWGSGESGQIGNGTAASPAPIGVNGLPALKQVSAGLTHTCGTANDGTTRCWGDNEFGQLGDGTTTNRTAPVAAFGVTGATTTQAGSGNSCALRNGAVWCWGHNSSGQLGNGDDTGADATTFTQVNGLESGVAALAVGGDHSCALTTSGQVRCWGYNLAGQVGDGTFFDRYAPIAVPGLGSGVRAIAAGARHSCAITSDQRVRCWGYNGGGALGHGGTEVAVPSAVQVQGLTGVVAITAGGSHTCALLSGGAVRCWGSNAFGAIGDGTRTDRSAPTQVSGLTSGVVQISAGAGHTCATLSTGALRCWGYNGSGQLGNGTTTDALTPVTVVGTGA